MAHRHRGKRWYTRLLDWALRRPAPEPVAYPGSSYATEQVRRRLNDPAWANEPAWNVPTSVTPALNRGPLLTPGQQHRANSGFRD